MALLELWLGCLEGLELIIPGDPWGFDILGLLGSLVLE